MLAPIGQCRAKACKNDVTPVAQRCLGERLCGSGGPAWKLLAHPECHLGATLSIEGVLDAFWGEPWVFLGCFWGAGNHRKTIKLILISGLGGPRTGNKGSLECPWNPKVELRWSKVASKAQLGEKFRRSARGARSELWKLSGNRRASAQTQVRSEVKVYLSDKAYD